MKWIIITCLILCWAASVVILQRFLARLAALENSTTILESHISQSVSRIEVLEQSNKPVIKTFRFTGPRYNRVGRLDDTPEEQLRREHGRNR